jgi:hypothetical protein
MAWCLNIGMILPLFKMEWEAVILHLFVYWSGKLWSNLKLSTDHPILAKVFCVVIPHSVVVEY